MLYRQIGPPARLAYALRHEADILRESCLPAEAEPLYLEAEGIYRQQGEEAELDLANTLRGLALVYESVRQSGCLEITLRAGASAVCEVRCAGRGSRVRGETFSTEVSCGWQESACFKTFARPTSCRAAHMSGELSCPSQGAPYLARVRETDCAILQPLALRYSLSTC